MAAISRTCFHWQNRMLPQSSARTSWSGRPRTLNRPIPRNASPIDSEKNTPISTLASSRTPRASSAPSSSAIPIAAPSAGSIIP